MGLLRVSSSSSASAASLGVEYWMYSMFAAAISGSLRKLMYISAASFFRRLSSVSSLILGMHIASKNRLVPSLGMTKRRLSLTAIILTASPA